MRFRRRSSHEFGWWCWLLLLATAWGVVGAEPMVVFLKNGDRLTGEITSENDRRIILRSAVTGRIVIPREQVDRVVSVAALAASTATPAPTDPPEPAAPEPEEPVAATPVPAPPDPAPPPAAPAAPVDSVVATNAPAIAANWLPGWFTGVWTNWHGNAQVGANMGFGTAERYAVLGNARAVKNWGRTTSTVTYNVNYGVADGVVNANRMAGDVQVDVNLRDNRRLYTYGQGGAGYDEIRQINVEYSMGSGMGYRFIDRPRLVVAGETGGQYQFFNFKTTSDRENIAIRLAENLTTKLGKDVSVTQNLGFTPAVEDLSDYTVRFGVTFSVPLFKPVTFNFNLVNEYDSKPAPGVSNNDLQLSTTFGITF